MVHTQSFIFIINFSAGQCVAMSRPTINIFFMFFLGKVATKPNHRGKGRFRDTLVELSIEIQESQNEIPPKDIFYRKSSIVNINRHNFICITVSIRAVSVHLNIEQTSNRQLRQEGLNEVTNLANKNKKAKCKSFTTDNLSHN